MIKIIQLLCLTILGIISYFSYIIYFERADNLAYIYTGNDIIEYYQEHGNQINHTQYNDRKYALEFLDICYSLEYIDLFSQEFINLSSIGDLKNYMDREDIVEPKDCIQGEQIWDSKLLPSCIFNNEESLHAPYLAAYLNRTITVARFSNAMSAISEHYKNIYPSNAYILNVLGDKAQDITINKQYCNEVLIDNIGDFIRPLDNK